MPGFFHARWSPLTQQNLLQNSYWWLVGLTLSGTWRKQEYSTWWSFVLEIPLPSFPQWTPIWHFQCLERNQPCRIFPENWLISRRENQRGGLDGPLPSSSVRSRSRWPEKAVRVGQGPLLPARTGLSSPEARVPGEIFSISFSSLLNGSPGWEHRLGGLRGLCLAKTPV